MEELSPLEKLVRGTIIQKEIDSKTIQCPCGNKFEPALGEPLFNESLKFYYYSITCPKCGNVFERVK
jgi:hypothetical protein